MRQAPDFCGEAAATMALRRLGQPYSQAQVFAASGMSPARGMGATTRELATALSRIGFEVGPVWHTVAPHRAEAGVERLFAELHADLLRSIPSIVCMRYDGRSHTTEHFRLVVGYDAATDEVIYHEPAKAHGAYRRMARRAFESLWPLKYRSDAWTVIRLRLEPRALKPPAALPQPSAADLAQHVRALRSRLPKGFSLVVEPPFVVLGDGGPKRVAHLARGTVRWAVRLLEQDYFAKRPKRILDIWLFQGEQSYRHHALSLFGEQPSTPYGYYSDEHHALVMNIATGGGTLVHEIVHPYFEADCPPCPTWLNEGLGSLYEQSAEQDGHIVGLTNWRLAGLQRAIRRDRVPSFRRLTALTERDFYRQDRGTNYAQARYLLYYLQEHGLLRGYYRAVRAGAASDPTGYLALRRALGEPDMAAFERRWRRYVLGLHFP